MTADFFAWLKDNAPTAQGRVYALHLPQKPTLPALTFLRVSAARDLCTDAPSGSATARWQVDAWADTYAAARDMADEIRTALHGFKGTMGSTVVQLAAMEDEQDIYTDDPPLYRVSLDFFITYEE